jgi:hypothetical protein
MENGVETLNARNRNTRFLGELQWRAQVSFNLHGTLGLEVEPHGAVILLWLQHLLESCFPKVGWENAILRFGKRK